MKAFAVGLSGAVLLALAAGCRPQLAEVELGDAEMQWNTIVRESYPGFRPPRTAPPAIKDKNTPLESVVPDTVLPAEGTTSEPATPAEPVMTDAVEDLSGAPAAVAAEPAAEPAADVAAQKPAASAKSAAAEPKSEGKFTEYVVKPGDSLSSLAKKFYKDGRRYNRIYEANKSVIKNPNRLPLGAKIRIPQL